MRRSRHTSRRLFGLTLTLVGLLSWHILPIPHAELAVRAANRAKVADYQSCDVQIIAATSRNLPTMIHNGEFREDLYCRLAVLTMETPPLSERRGDIPAMIAGFLRQAGDAVNGPSQHKVYEIKEDALACFQSRQPFRRKRLNTYKRIDSAFTNVSILILKSGQQL